MLRNHSGLGLRGLGIALLSLVGLAAGPAQGQQGVVCRAKYVLGWEREYFEAMLFMPGKTARPDELVVYIATRPDGQVYVHSNFLTRAKAATANLLDRERDGDELTETERIITPAIRTFYVRLGDVWRFAEPTKVVFPERMATAEYLLALFNPPGETMPDEERDQLKQALVDRKVKFILSPSAQGMNLENGLNVERADLKGCPIGAECNQKYIPFCKGEYEEAIAQIGEATTSNVEECVVFLTKRPDGFVYVQTNYRPTLPGGELAPFPAKLATRGERDLFFLICQMVFVHNVPRPPDESLQRLWAAHQTKIRYVVTPALLKELNLESAGRVEEAK
jgi:hypothetical protein